MLKYISQTAQFSLPFKLHLVRKENKLTATQALISLSLSKNTCPSGNTVLGLIMISFLVAILKSKACLGINEIRRGTKYRPPYFRSSSRIVAAMWKIADRLWTRE